MSVTVDPVLHVRSAVDRLAKLNVDQAALRAHAATEVDTVAVVLDSKRIRLSTYPHDELVPQTFIERRFNEHGEILQDVLRHTERSATSPEHVPPLRVLSAEAIRADLEVTEAINIIKTGIPNRFAVVPAMRSERETMQRLFATVFTKVQERTTVDAYQQSNAQRYAILAESLHRIAAEKDFQPIRPSVIKDYRAVASARLNAALAVAGMHSLHSAAWLGAAYASHRLMTQPLLRWGTTSNNRFGEYTACVSKRIARCPAVPISRTSLGADPECADEVELGCEELAGGRGVEEASLFSWIGSLCSGIPASIGLSRPAMAHASVIPGKLLEAYAYERTRAAFVHEAKRT